MMAKFVSSFRVKSDCFRFLDGKYDKSNLELGNISHYKKWNKMDNLLISSICSI